jgi:hypothetical protein
MSRFPAEVVVTLTDGSTLTECFNQAEMAQFMRERMAQAVERRESVVVFDGDRVEVPAERVASVHLVV